MRHVTLVGIDGNAFNIMAYVSENMRRMKFTKQERDKYVEEATSSDYDRLIQVSIKYTDLINDRIDAYNEEHEEYDESDEYWLVR